MKRATTWVAAAFALAAMVPAPQASAQLPVGDIVFMIDESGSMGPDIADVRNNVNLIANQLGASIDFQLGLIGFGDGSHFGAACSGCAHIHQTLTSDVPTFQAAVNGLVASGGFEPGFQATVLGMSNAMGFRPGAGVCAILISDEDADVGGAAPETKAQALAALNGRNAVFFGIVDGGFGNTVNDYGPNAGSLAAATGGQVFDLLAFRNNPQPVLTALINACAEVIGAIVVTPDQAENPINSDHTVTAEVTESSQPVVGTLVSFEVLSGPNAGEVSDPGECSANADCTTDANGLVSWTYTGSGGVGVDEIEGCFTDSGGNVRCNTATKTWVIPPCSDPAPLTQGFWRRVCKKPHPDQPDRSILTPELCEDLNPDPHSDPCERARSQFAALQYNILSDRVQEGCVDDGAGGSVGDTVAAIEALLADGSRNACKEASRLAASINEGNVSEP